MGEGLVAGTEGLFGWVWHLSVVLPFRCLRRGYHKGHGVWLRKQGWRDAD